VEAPAGEPYRARLDNASDLPHTFTIEALDIEVFVPAGRWAIIELDPDALADAPLAVICTIGDHLAQGMASVIEIRLGVWPNIAADPIGGSRRRTSVSAAADPRAGPTVRQPTGRGGTRR
ncbi:MAG: hypothetical protein WBL31_02135, partial [Ilumatobacteraceae bacterium]